MTLFRGALPNVNGAGSANAVVSNHRSGRCSLPARFGFFSWSGRCAGPAPIFAWSTPRFTVNGAPDCAVKMALIRQSLSRTSDTRPASANDGV